MRSFDNKPWLYVGNFNEILDTYEKNVLAQRLEWSNLELDHTNTCERLNRISTTKDHVF